MSKNSKGKFYVVQSRPITTIDENQASVIRQKMEKAGAFITDEGGALCHAAIIARELNKPCIIGTKFATASPQRRRPGGGGC